MHGRSKRIIVTGIIKKGAQGIELSTIFPLNTDDFRIEIPFIVRSKVSKNVNTQLYCVLQ
jgi:hypothetical protein